MGSRLAFVFEMGGITVIVVQWRGNDMRERSDTCRSKSLDTEEGMTSVLQVRQVGFRQKHKQFSCCYRYS